MTNPTSSTTIKNHIAVASGKGGVGKSTVAVNLAIALSQQGLKVGILDADIYGPSVPILLGIKGKQPAIDPEKKKILPLEKFGLKIMSIGSLLKENDAVVWRGPMIHKTLQQFLDEVEWGNLDILIIDLPPGTGDVQISLSQLVPITGAVVVTTPQDVAVADVVRALSMFEKVKIPILGVVENMSYFTCPHCQGHTEIFSRGGGKKLAETYKTALLGEIPLDQITREGSDAGTPVTIQAAGSSSAEAFKKIGQKLQEVLASRNEGGVKIEMS